MVLTIYFLLFFTALAFVSIIFLFVYLVFRKIFLNYFQKRQNAYYNKIYPHISRFITSGSQDKLRVTLTEKKWKKKIILSILIEIALVIRSEEELFRLHQLANGLQIEQELTKQISDYRWWVSSEAIRIIGLLRLESFIPHLIKNLNSEIYELRTSSARALCRLNQYEKIMQFLIDYEEVLDKKIMMQFGEIVLRTNIQSINDMSLILKNIDNVSQTLQGIFIDILAARKNIESIPIVTSFLRSEHFYLRAKSLRAIAEFQITLDDSEIIKFLSSDNWSERVLAINVIKKCRLTQAIPYLLEHNLCDSNWWVRIRTAQALYDFGNEGINALLWASKNHVDSYARDVSKKVLEEQRLGG